MRYQKREELLLEEKFYNNRMELVSIGTKAPVNQQIILRLSCLAWEFKQSYKTDAKYYYIRKRIYMMDADRIKQAENAIEVGGLYEDEARKTASEVKEYLWIIGGSKVRVKDNNRVY